MLICIPKKEGKRVLQTKYQVLGCTVEKLGFEQQTSHLEMSILARATFKTLGVILKHPSFIVRKN